MKKITILAIIATLMMAMNLLRDAKQLVRIELSATMLWNHPSISQMSEFVAELLAPMQQDQNNAVEPDEPEGSYLAVRRGPAGTGEDRVEVGVGADQA